MIHACGLHALRLLQWDNNGSKVINDGILMNLMNLGIIL